VARVYVLQQPKPLLAQLYVVDCGVGRPEGLNRGYYVRPTVFGDVRNDMSIAREEIFGPVLSVMPYDSEEQAIEIANDTPYGLSTQVASKDPEHARRVARRLRAGQVKINYRPGTPSPRSAATSSPATAANTPTGPSTTSWRSRASSATARHRARRSRSGTGCAGVGA
jgi:acyl-CoA reductase-like NAD-dependent aldehyde dehydrogenase